MGSPGNEADRIAALRGMLDRLCAPDLTLSEAKVLVPHLSSLLDAEPKTSDRLGGGSCQVPLGIPDR